MGYIEDSSVELNSWCSLYREGGALLFDGLSKPKPGGSSPDNRSPYLSQTKALVGNRQDLTPNSRPVNPGSEGNVGSSAFARKTGLSEQR